MNRPALSTPRPHQCYCPYIGQLQRSRIEQCPAAHWLLWGAPQRTMTLVELVPALRRMKCAAKKRRPDLPKQSNTCPFEYNSVHQHHYPNGGISFQLGLPKQRGSMQFILMPHGGECVCCCCCCCVPVTSEDIAARLTGRLGIRAIS